MNVVVIATIKIVSVSKMTVGGWLNGNGYPGFMKSTLY